MATLVLNVDPTGAVTGSLKAGDALDQVKRKSRGATDQLGKTSKAANVLGRAFKVAAVSVVALGAAFATKAVPAFLAQSKALAEVSTLLDGNAAEIEKVDKASRELASQFGGSATAQVSAFYQAISAGAGDAAQATELLRTANVLAKGGVTDITTAVDILTTAVSVYGKEGLTAAQAADDLFTGVKIGKTNVEQLAGSLGKVLPFAKELGIGFDEVTAAVAGLTRGGIATTEAVTGYKAILAAITKPSSEAAKLAKELAEANKEVGFEFSAAGLEGKTFAEFMAEVVEVTGGSVEQMALLFGGTEAIIPALSLAGASGEIMAEALGKMAVNAGAAQKASDIVAGSLEDRLGVQLGKVGNAALVLGEVLTQAIVPALEIVTGAFEAIGPAADIILIAFSGLAFATIPAMVSGLVTLTGTLVGVTGGLTAMTTAVNLARLAYIKLLGPFGLAFALAGSAAAAYVVAKEKAAALGIQLDATAISQGQVNSALELFYTTGAPAAGSAAVDLANEYVKQEAATLRAAEAQLVLNRATFEAAKIAGEVKRGAVSFGQSTTIAEVTRGTTGAEVDALGNVKTAVEEVTLAEAGLAEAIRRRGETQDAVFDKRRFDRPVPGAAIIPGGTVDSEIAKYKALIKELQDQLANRGGGAATAVSRLKDEFKAMIVEVTDGTATMDEYRTAIEAVDAAFEAGVIDADEQRAAIEAITVAMNKGKEASEQMAQTFARTASSIIRGAESAKDAIGGLIDRLADQALTSGLSGIFSNLFPGVTDFFGNIIGNAKGNAFSGGNVIPFASGGIVNSPTLFSMSGGRTGLMGEAGQPEAILPLKRGPGGRLGVDASGQSDVSIVFNIDARGAVNGVGAEIEAAVARQAPIIEARAVAAVKKASARGY